MKNSEKILDKIRKLLAKAKDPAASENEVEIFMKKAQELMTRYKLEEGDIEIHQSDIGKDVVFSDLSTAFKYKYKNFEWEIIDMIAEFNQCSIFSGSQWFPEQNVRKTRLTIIGTRENRIVVSEMYEMLSHKFLTLSNIRYKEYQTKEKKRIIATLKEEGMETKGMSVKFLEGINLMIRKGTWVSSYLIGCISGLRSALKDQRKMDLVLECDNSKFALMVVKHDELIKLSLPTLIGRFKSSSISNKSNFDSSAFQEGIKDGKSNHTNKYLE